jgi:hypothetical protein
MAQQRKAPGGRCIRRSRPRLRDVQGDLRACIYDNMKTTVETVFVGKNRLYNRRFLQMCSHYLVEPVACTPASGWEKGQVENQVGLVRERFFTPRLRFKSYDELNVRIRYSYHIGFEQRSSRHRIESFVAPSASEQDNHGKQRRNSLCHGDVPVNGGARE